MRSDYVGHLFGHWAEFVVRNRDFRWRVSVEIVMNRAVVFENGIEVKYCNMSGMPRFGSDRAEAPCLESVVILAVTC